MIQIFVFGSSSSYGVGSQSNGWADFLKEKLHALMYSENGVGEKYELYNFAKPGVTIKFVFETFKYQLEKYRRSGEVVIVVSVGGNNSKAEDEQDNFVSTIKEYEEEMSELLMELNNNSSKVLFVGSGCVDELKTNPKPNPLTGGKSYFSNKRRLEFEYVLKKLCMDIGVAFIETGVSNTEWIEK